MPRCRYNRISPTDRSRIVRAANDGGNWRQLAEQLGVNHKTAYTWIREGRDEAKQKGGRRRKCTNEQIDVLVAMIESDPTLTLRQLSETEPYPSLESMSGHQLSTIIYRGDS